MSETHVTEIQTAYNTAHVIDRLGNELVALTSRLNDAMPRCREAALVVTKLQEASLWLGVVAHNVAAPAPTPVMES